MVEPGGDGGAGWGCPCPACHPARPKSAERERSCESAGLAFGFHEISASVQLKPATLGGQSLWLHREGAEPASIAAWNSDVLHPISLEGGRKEGHVKRK